MSCTSDKIMTKTSKKIVPNEVLNRDRVYKSVSSQPYNENTQLYCNRQQQKNHSEHVRCVVVSPVDVKKRVVEHG